MELCWLDEHTARVSELPDVTVSFAKAEDENLTNIVLGMLLQSFSK